MTSPNSPCQPKMEVWIALVGVEPLPGNDWFRETARYACAHWLTLATSESMFVAKVKEACEFYRLMLVRIMDCEPLSVRVQRESISEELAKLASEITSEKHVRFATFFCSTDEEE